MSTLLAKTDKQGYEANNPNIELLRLKNFTIGKKLEDKEVVAPGGLGRIAGLVGTLAPFVSSPRFHAAIICQVDSRAAACFSVFAGLGPQSGDNPPKLAHLTFRQQRPTCWTSLRARVMNLHPASWLSTSRASCGKVMKVVHTVDPSCNNTAESG
jgi:Conserved hypothetical protein (DUF2461)